MCAGLLDRLLRDFILALELIRQARRIDDNYTWTAGSAHGERVTKLMSCSRDWDWPIAIQLQAQHPFTAGFGRELYLVSRACKWSYMHLRRP